jgi:hypothetical protein
MNDLLKYMLPKVYRWNYYRDNMQFDAEVEGMMLAEEHQEFLDAYEKMLEEIKNEKVDVDKVVEYVALMMDSYIDYLFVFAGTLSKEFYNAEFQNQDGIYIFIDIMDSILSEIFTEKYFRKAFKIVMEANEKKKKDKLNGKILKGSDFEDPLPKMKELVAKPVKEWLWKIKHL